MFEKYPFSVTKIIQYRVDKNSGWLTKYNIYNSGLLRIKKGTYDYETS